MLRSQSISNLSEKKSRPGFLSSLKSRKSSSQDLKAQLNTTERRPLTSSVSSLNLLKHHDGKNSYTSTVARQRGADKENVAPPTFKSLKTRSSSPNLKSTTFKREKRESTFINKISLPSSLSLMNILSDDETIADSNSPYTPPSSETTNSNDTLVDESPILIQQFDYYHISDDEDFEDAIQDKGQVPQSNYKLPRTTNILDINEFISSISHTNNEIIPINNRRSLDFEESEREMLKLSLQETGNSNVDLKLVGNVVFLSTGSARSNELYSWYDEDYASLLYDTDDEEDLYMRL